MANPAWQPNASFAAFTVIVDSNGNVEQATAAGRSGATAPVWPTSVGGKVSDGTVGWTCVAVLGPPAIPSGVAGLPPPEFVNDPDALDPELVLADMIESFESAAGRKLYPAQVERLLINLYAYRETIVRAIMQWIGEQNLLAFAQFPNLDYLGQLLGIERLGAQPATTTLQFTLQAALTVSLRIPAGTLVGSQDGANQFATDSDLAIPAGDTQGTVTATALTPGTGGNGYVAGQINVLLTPNALIAGVSNTTTATGGSVPETDDHLRTRIQAAPNRFTTAGPAASYRFYALGVDPSIIDALVNSPVPGSVNVYILTGPTSQPAASPNSQGIAGASLLAEVEATLSAETVRPLTDTVTALAVSEVDYQIIGTVTLYSNADPVSVEAAVNEAAVIFAQQLAARIRRDIVPEEIVAALGSVSGVYRVTLSSPFYTQLNPGQWANCTQISLSFATASEGQ